MNRLSNVIRWWLVILPTNCEYNIYLVKLRSVVWIQKLYLKFCNVVGFCIHYLLELSEDVTLQFYTFKSANDPDLVDDTVEEIVLFKEVNNSGVVSNCYNLLNRTVINYQTK